MVHKRVNFADGTYGSSNIPKIFHGDTDGFPGHKNSPEMAAEAGINEVGRPLA